MMKDWFDQLKDTGVIPVVTLKTADKAAALASALADGGLGSLEVTFRTEAAADSIYRIRQAVPDVFVGAGTILTESALNDALDAGAQFIVAPGFNPKIADAAMQAGIPYLPGVMTPTEIEAAMAFGLTVLKFFPAEAAGGAAMLKALTAPYSSVRFMPTGGITPKNLRDYLSVPSVFCCGGSFVADNDSLGAGDFEAVRIMAGKTAALVRSIRGGTYV